MLLYHLELNLLTFYQFIKSNSYIGALDYTSVSVVTQAFYMCIITELEYFLHTLVWYSCHILLVQY